MVFIDKLDLNLNSKQFDGLSIFSKKQTKCYNPFVSRSNFVLYEKS